MTGFIPKLALIILICASYELWFRPYKLVHFGGTDGRITYKRGADIPLLEDSTFLYSPSCGYYLRRLSHEDSYSVFVYKRIRGEPSSRIGFDDSHYFKNTEKVMWNRDNEIVVKDGQREEVFVCDEDRVVKKMKNQHVDIMQTEQRGGGLPKEKSE